VIGRGSLGLLPPVVTLTRRLHTLARLLQDPRLLRLRRRGGMVPLFVALDRPWFHALDIATVLDIGAHDGSFAITLDALLPQARIVAFEPLPDCFEKLRARTAGGRCVAVNAALGEEPGETTFQRLAFSPASSFLTPTRMFRMEYPAASDSTPVNVKVARLDDVAEALGVVEPILAKIDVQGYEDRVLRGGERTLRRARLMIVETSFIASYEGQPLFSDVYRILAGWGFAYAGCLDQLALPSSGRIFQEDSLFIRDG
jgi:FkbM family methyltransferase